MSNTNDKLNKVASALKGEHGCFLLGKIEGVDFTVAGKMDNGMAYGSSIKLKFAQKQEILKNINGVDVPTTKFNSQIIKISVSDSELAQKVQEFNSKIDKEVIIPLELADNATFKTTKVQEI